MTGRVAGFGMDGKLYASAHHWPRGWYDNAVANPEIMVERDNVVADRNFKGPFYTLGHVRDRLKRDTRVLERGLGSVGGQEVARELQASPPAGEYAVERVTKVCERLISMVTQDLNLAAAGVTALTSGDPAVSASAQWQTTVIGPCMEAAFGDEDVGDRQEVCDLFGHLVFTVMVGLANGQHDSVSANALLKSAARRILPRRS